MIENRRFNRVETFGQDSYYSLSSGEHIYYADRAFQGIGETEYHGFIKCKLAHGSNYSVIIPDFLFLGEEGRLWVQPLAFFAPLLGKLDETIECVICADISCGHTLRIKFANSDFVSRLPDCSEIYRCRIYGPDDLSTYATGESELRAGTVPFVRLYHHTHAHSKANIFRLSDLETYVLACAGRLPEMEANNVPRR
jgi:hypothetical protein